MQIMTVPKTIGFFGDSFCSVLDSTLPGKIDTYIKKLKSFYNADILNLGVAGSSIEDALLLQLKPFETAKKFPDVCIFVWTDPGRIFHRTTRNINHSTMLRHVSDPKSPKIWNDALNYYENFYDPELADVRYIALLHYIDNVILPTICSTSKIIHMWSFEKDFNSGEYYYRWNNGAEIRPALFNISLTEQKETPIYEDRPNHLGSEINNEIIFNWIKTAIDDYKSGKLHTYNIKEIK
jgi:hypothetical protein